MKWTRKQRQRHRPPDKKAALDRHVKIVLQPRWVRFSFDCDKLKILSIHPHCGMRVSREISGISQSIEIEDGVECIDLPNSLCIPAMDLMNRFMPPDEGIGGRLISIYEPVQKVKLRFNEASVIRLSVRAMHARREIESYFNGMLTIYGNREWDRRSEYRDVWTPVSFKVKFRISQGLVNAVRSLDEER